VLRQVWEEKLSPALVINKVDRLISELRLTPAEAYERLKRLLSEANGVMSGFASEKYLNDADAFVAVAASPAAGEEEPPAAEEEAEEEDVFSCAKGNVAFASAADGWAFRTDTFARIYAARLGCSRAALTRALWGEYFYSPKTKRILAGRRAAEAAGGRLKPLFVQLALEPLWQLYAAAEAEAEAAAEGRWEAGPPAPAPGAPKSLAAMAASLGVAEAVSRRDLAGPDRRAALRAVLRAWLPLSDAVLSMAVRCLPDPVAAAALRLPHLLPGGGCVGDPALLAALRACDSSGPPLAFVSKMFAAPPGALPGAPAGGGERFIAFARVFAGSLRPGQEVHVMAPGWAPGAGAGADGPQDGAAEGEAPPRATVDQLYCMMGRSLFPLSHAPAGSVVALSGLDTAVLKCATLLCASLPPAAAPPLRGMFFQAAPIVRVALEPRAAQDLPAMLAGLRLLNRADPSVELSYGQGGETVLGVAGEVHLERCLKDLRDRFARVPLTASQPLVGFKETAHGAAWPALLGALLQPCPGGCEALQRRFASAREARTPGGSVSVRARAAPLPAAAVCVLARPPPPPPRTQLSRARAG